jgi:hypothetical protein
MTLSNFAGIRILPAALPAALLFVFPGTSKAQTQTTEYMGEATVAAVSVLGFVNVSIEDTGPLPKSGGSLSIELAQLDTPNLLDLHLLDASTTGASNLPV